MKQFDHIIGQEIAKQRLSDSVKSFVNGGEALSPLVIGEAGLGKTKLCEAYVNAMEDEAGVDVIRHKSPEEIRSKGATWDRVCQVIKEGNPYILFFDEAHLFKNRQTIQMAQLFGFLLKALEKQDGRPIQFGEDAVVFDRKKHAVVLATNFPRILDKSGAFQSRCDTVVLDKYSHEELIAILQVMLTEAGLKPANEKTLSHIANCGRGTARPMERIVGQLRITLKAEGNKTTINREDVLNALRLSKLYPMGLEPFEVQLLQRCSRSAQRDNVLRSTLPSVEPSQFAASKGYLMGNHLMVQTGQGIETSDHGREYLNGLAKAGFNLPR